MIYRRGSTSYIIYTSNIYHVHNRVHLRQSYKFYIPTGCYIILSMYLLSFVMENEHDKCLHINISNIHMDNVRVSFEVYS